MSSREQTLCPLDFYNQFVPSIRRQYWTLCADKPLVQWRAWLTPAARTPYYWYQSALLYGEFEWDSLNETSTLALEPLLDPNEPFSLAACIAVLVVMAVKSDAPAASAVDIIIQAIDDKRLDGPLLAQAAIWWLRNDLPFRVRWLRRFRTIAEQSHNHAQIIHYTLEAIVPVLQSKELGVFLELLNELCVTLDKGVENEACRAFLREIKGSGKAAKHARTVLSFTKE